MTEVSGKGPGASPRGTTPRLAGPEKPRSLRHARIGAVFVAAAVLVIAQRLGIFHQFADPARVKQTLVEQGAWGYGAFVVAYAILQPFGVPGTVFILAAPMIWPWPVAFALSMAGTMAASVVGFSFARFIARDWVTTRIPPWLKRYEAALARRAFSTVFLLRFVFWMPQVLHTFLGVSSVSFSTHFWASLCGYVLPILLVSFFGQKLFDVMKHAPATVWLGLGAAILALALRVWLRRASPTRGERPGGSAGAVGE
jgi:uncharacterized membrane protein YdjX (TVP38/TMEM64 family)